MKTKNDEDQTQFIQQLNEELEQNRLSHPSLEDDAEMNQEMADEAQDNKLIELVKDHGQRKKAERQRSGSGNRDGNSEHAASPLQRNSSTRSSRVENNLKKAVE